MKYKEIVSLDPLLRVIEVETIDGETGADILNAGHLPQINSNHPVEPLAFVTKVLIEEKGPRKFWARVIYQYMQLTELTPPMPKVKDPKPESGDKCKVCRNMPPTKHRGCTGKDWLHHVVVTDEDNRNRVVSTYRINDDNSIKITKVEYL